MWGGLWNGVDRATVTAATTGGTRIRTSPSALVGTPPTGLRANFGAGLGSCSCMRPALPIGAARMCWLWAAEQTSSD